MVKLVIVVVCAFVLACPAQALLYDSGNPPAQWGLLPLATADWGQPFTTAKAWNITSISTAQSGCGTSDTLYVKLKQGSTVLGSWSRAGWAGGGWAGVSTNVTISPGSYTIVFSHANATAWAIGNPCPNGSNGWFDQRPYLGDDGVFVQTGPLALRMGGTVVPEPVSLSLVGLLLGGLALKVRRRP